MANRFQYPALAEPVGVIGAGGTIDELIFLDKFQGELSQPLPKRKARNAALASDMAFSFVFVPSLIPGTVPTPVWARSLRAVQVYEKELRTAG